MRSVPSKWSLTQKSCILIACAYACLPPTANLAVAADDVLSPDMVYQAAKSNPVTYDVDFSAVVTPPAKTKKLRVWLPLPQSDSAQQVTEGEYLYSFPDSVKPQIASEPLYGNKFAYFEFADPQGAQMIRHTFKMTTHELRWRIDPAKVKPIEKWPESFAPYMRGEGQAVVINDTVNKVLAEIIPKRRDPYSDLVDVMNWQHANLKYSHETASLAASSQNALASHGGHCSDYHGLCAAFGRALGFPTRVTYGINPFPKASPSHCKLEAFLPPYGWVSFDISETQNLMGLIAKEGSLSEDQKKKLTAAAKERFLSGYRDNTWFLQTRGTDYDLAPPAAKRAAIVRTIYAEADGVALPEPDPSNSKKHEFAWMTFHKYSSDKPVKYPFKDIKSLETQP